jgi:hypothetical protein
MPPQSVPLEHGRKPTLRQPLPSPSYLRMRRSESSLEPPGRAANVWETPAQPIPSATHPSVYKVSPFNCCVSTLSPCESPSTILLSIISSSDIYQMGHSASVTSGVLLPSLPGSMLRALGILIWSVKGDRSSVLKQRPLVSTSNSGPLQDLWANLLKVAVTGRALDLTLTFKLVPIRLGN